MAGEWDVVSTAPVASADSVSKSTDTQLTPDQEQDYFLTWKPQNAPRDSGYDYDQRGAYLADRAGTLPARDERGHGTDTFKKPNHPTYSTGSQIKDPNGLEPGVWSQDAQGRTVFTPGSANLAYHSPDELRDYFSKVESDAVLNIPQSAAPADEWGVVSVTPMDPGDRVRAKMDNMDRSIGTIAKDLAVKAAGGANAMVGNVADLYGLATGNMDNPVSRQAKSGQEYFEKMVSPQLKAAEAERRKNIDAADGQLAKAGVAIWDTISNPALLSSFMAEQTSQLVPVAGAGRAAGVAAKALGAGEAAAKAAAVTGAVGTGAAMQGADSGGDAYDRLMALPDAVWDQNPRYQALRRNGMKAARAKQRIAVSLSQDATVAAAVVSGALNLLPGASTVEKALSGVKLPAGSMVKGAVGGLVGEGLQEGGEEGLGMVAQNAAVQGIDPSQELSQGVGEAAGLGAVVGGPMGGAFGAFSPHEAQSANADSAANEQPSPDMPSVDDLIGEQVGDGTPNAEGGVTVPPPAPPPPGFGSGGDGGSTLSPADLRIRAIRDAIHAGRPIPPNARDQLQELPVEDVEAAPAPENPALVDAADELRTQMREPAPANNIEVTEQERTVTPVELAPPPVETPVEKWTPPSNIDLQESDIQDMDAEAAQMTQERANESRASRLPPDWNDKRLARDTYRYHLRGMAEDLEKGGGIAYKQDESGTITGRTPSVNPGWFKAMNENADTKMTVDATRQAVQKALKGEKLGVREARVVGAMLDEVSGQRQEQVDYVKAELEKARAMRRGAVDPFADLDTDTESAGELFREKSYKPDWDGETRAFYELADQARKVDADATEAILESQADDQTVARRLAEIIHGRQTQSEAQPDATSSDREAGRRQEDQAASSSQVPQSDAPRPEDEAIAPYTAADLAARETQKAKAETDRRNAETKAAADDARGDFTLTGSDRTADTAAAAGQQDLLASNPPDKSKAAKPLYASRQVTNAADIIAWAKEQGFPSTLSPDDLHVTVAYSREPVDGASVKSAAGKLSAIAGKRTVEKLGDEGAVVLKFESADLKKRWQHYRDAGASWDYDQYMPHVTITYDGGDIDLSKVKPYAGPIELGAEKQEPLNLDKSDDYKETEKPTSAATDATTEKPNPADIIKKIPPAVLRRIKVKVEQMHEGEGVKRVEVSATDALKDIRRETATFKKLLDCVSR